MILRKIIHVLRTVSASTLPVSKDVSSEIAPNGFTEGEGKFRLLE